MERIGWLSVRERDDVQAIQDHHPDRSARAAALTILVGVAAAFGRPAFAATPPSPGGIAVTVAVEPQDARYAYHFDNPSSFEPGPLVPHFFEQRYDASDLWTLVSVRYSLFDARGTTTVGAAPSTQRSGSDVDTFFQPSGDIITSGTRGDVDLGSFSIEQRFDLATWRGWRFGVVLGYTRSRAGFLPSDRVVTHTLPESDTSEPVPGHETTWSAVLASGVSAARETAIGRGWRLDLAGDLRPLTRAWLTVSLPDKYPGQKLVFEALSLGTAARVSFAHALSQRIDVELAAGASGAWGYRSVARYGERSSFLRLGLTMAMR